jgi:hypothetical protein
MAKYLVTKLSFITDHLVEPGTIIDFDGVPSKVMVPQDKAAKAAVKASGVETETETVTAETTTDLA